MILRSDSHHKKHRRRSYEEEAFYYENNDEVRPQLGNGFLFIVSALSIIVLCALLLKWNADHSYVTVELAESEVTMEYGSEFTPPEVTALYHQPLLPFYQKQLTATQYGDPGKSAALGPYKVTYTASYHDKSAAADCMVNIVDTTPPVITLVSDPEYFTSPIAEYVEEGYSALDNYDGDVTDLVQTSEQDGWVTYTVTDSSGNASVTTREIIYKDIVPPEITLTGDPEINWQIGRDYEDPGCTAADDCDGDITDRINVTGSVNSEVMGSYTLTYSVEDSYHNRAETTRTVHVADITPPDILLKGDVHVYLTTGEAYTEPGYQAVDQYEGDVTNMVAVEGSVDTNTPGDYTLSYIASDHAGNSVTVHRVVYVRDQQAQAEIRDPGSKVIYLTFDDGPGAYTDQLLEVLARYDVKVTFFVTNQFPSYQYCLAEEAAAGHTVAVHSYSHQYASIYTGEDAFYSDVDSMAQIIYDQTGIQPSILRFPGGASNTISSNYCVGIMTALTESCAAHGYQYCDWNVDSNDAGGATTAEEVYQNVIEGVSGNNISVVLQHDIKSYSVEAVEMIINWGLENGYTFLPLTDSSPMVHHHVNN